MKNTRPLLIPFLALSLPLLTAAPSWPQDDTSFHAVRVKGDVTAYHNENDETSRLYTSQTLDDGDKVTTAADSEAVLRLGPKSYLYLAPHTRIHITRLRQGDKGPQCQVNLVTGRLLGQLDPSLSGALEVTAGGVYCREHGTLFEVSRREEQLTVVSFQGAAVVNFHGKTKMAKDNEVLRLGHGKFRNKTHHLTNEQQEDLQAWQGLLAEITK